MSCAHIVIKHVLSGDFGTNNIVIVLFTASFELSDLEVIDRNACASYTGLSITFFSVLSYLLHDVLWLGKLRKKNTLYIRVLIFLPTRYWERHIPVKLVTNCVLVEWNTWLCCSDGKRRFSSHVQWLRKRFYYWDSRIWPLRIGVKQK